MGCPESLHRDKQRVEKQERPRWERERRKRSLTRMMINDQRQDQEKKMKLRRKELPSTVGTLNNKTNCSHKRHDVMQLGAAKMLTARSL
jgi:hypothetical protein